MLTAVKEKNILSFSNYGGFEERNESVIKYIQEADKFIDKQDYEFMVYTQDVPIFNWQSYSVLNFATITEDYSLTCPDFVFDRWKSVGIEDYESEYNKLIEAGKTNYLENKIGWIGSVTGTAREKFFNYIHENDFKFCDFSFTKFRVINGRVTAPNFLTLEQQVMKWKYLLDIEGAGWSARFKLLLWSGRPVFLIDRIYKEFFYKHLVPWEHFIPVKNDFSDLESNFNKVDSDLQLYRHISQESRKFCEKWLTKKAAVSQWVSVINGL